MLNHCRHLARGASKNRSARTQGGAGGPVSLSFAYAGLPWCKVRDGRPDLLNITRNS